MTIAVLAGLVFSVPSFAGALPVDLAGPGFTPRVPVSPLAAPAPWFDPARLRVSASVTVGSGFGRGVDALQVTSLSYQFQAPLWLSLSVGNAVGMNAARTGRTFFLEGFDVGYRPSPSMSFQVHYRDVRSPLQLPPGYGLWSP